MHNIRPAGQMWPVKTFTLAHKAQIYLYLAIFDGNTTKIGKNLTNLAHECFSNIFWPDLKSELCIPTVEQC